MVLYALKLKLDMVFLMDSRINSFTNVFPSRWNMEGGLLHENDELWNFTFNTWNLPWRIGESCIPWSVYICLQKNYTKGEFQGLWGMKLGLIENLLWLQIEILVDLNFKQHKALTHEEVRWRVQWLKIVKNRNDFMS